MLLSTINRIKEKAFGIRKGVEAQFLLLMLKLHLIVSRNWNNTAVVDLFGVRKLEPIVNLICRQYPFVQVKGLLQKAVQTLALKV